MRHKKRGTIVKNNKDMHNRVSLMSFKKLKFLFIAPLIGIVLSGCNSKVQDFVRGVKPELPTTDVPQEPNANVGGMKVSPGQMRAASSDTAVVANATTTNRVLSSSDVSARVSISRTRVSP